jgi:tryptophan 2,3-dioxygenase
MNNSDLNPLILEKIKKLHDKYESSGQDLSSYLEGLLYSDYLTYWDYIHLDTLLSLQNPKTSFPDEMIFITYHQFTELFFKLILWEMDQISNSKDLTGKIFAKKIERINRYFENLIRSFDVMVDGMDHDQFLKFRMALLPSSGFQSAQYRMIEIQATDMINLVAADSREEFAGSSSYVEMFEKIYWKKGATELATGKKTLSLVHFEEKYSIKLIKKAKKYLDKNLWQVYINGYLNDPQAELIRDQLRTFDAYANVNWPLAHYKSAVRYLQGDPDVIAATGGTNWQKYLPPRFKKIIFYPELWNQEERENWGKAWVMREIFKKGS